MDTIYLISLIVGGFFVLLSIFGGTEADADTDVDFNADANIDFDADADIDFDADADVDAADIGHDLHADIGVGLVDLLSIRALFLFAAFFGLTGTVLTWLGSGEPMTALLSVLTGLVVGLGGNYVIKRFAYEHVSSTVSQDDLKGRTAKVLLPFEGSEKGKISLIVKGQRMDLIARSLDDELLESFKPNDEVVVIRMNGSIAEVVKPN